MAMPLRCSPPCTATSCEGRDAEAARYYPSLGGHPDAEALWPHFLDARSARRRARCGADQ